MNNLLLDDFIKYKFLSNIKTSPDGKYACFIVNQPDLEDNDYKAFLWVYDIKSKGSFQLTSPGRVHSFLWLDNSEEVIFSAIREKKDQKDVAMGKPLTVFYKINIHGGEACEEFRVPLKVVSIKSLMADRYLLSVKYNASEKEYPANAGGEDPVYLKWKENKDYEVLEELPFWSNGQGFISGERTALYLYDKGSGDYKVLSKARLQISSVNLNADRTMALVIGKDFADKAPTTNSIYILNLVDESFKKITPDNNYVYSSAHFIDDNKAICKASNRERYGLSENSQFYILNIEDGSKELITLDFQTSTSNTVSSDCRFGEGESIQFANNFLYFITTEGDSSYLNRIDVSGRMERVSKERGSIDSYSVKDGNVLLIALRDLALQEVYQLEDGLEEQVTTFNSWVQKEKTLSKPEHLSLEISPGLTVDGWVMKPVDFQEGRKYPAILNIHGGPKTAYGTVYFHEMQYWTNRGYFVFFCNPRGSDGKGNEFADIRGRYGTIDYDDLMNFTDLVLRCYPSIDKERLGVAGGSYGGFMVNWIIGHTDRFKAAVSQRSISNWISMGFTADIGYYFGSDQVGATPWSDFEKVWYHSPLKYADKVKTPTLFIHAEEDYRCPLSEGLQMFSALKYHGVKSKLCMFRGENHELSRSGKPKHRIRRLEEIIDWFASHL